MIKNGPPMINIKKTKKLVRPGISTMYSVFYANTKNPTMNHINRNKIIINAPFLFLLYKKFFRLSRKCQYPLDFWKNF